MQIDLAYTVFTAFVALSIFAAIMVVTQNHPVRSVLFLVLTFFAVAVLWLLLQAEFLGLILVLVYVGAVMTLFLFVVMMLHVDVEALKSHLLRLLPLGVFIVGGLGALFLLAIAKFDWAQQGINFTPVSPVTNTEEIGLVLYTKYVYPFEIAAVLLLVAMVASITLVHRSIVRSKRQNVREQLMTNSKDRITMVSLDSKDKQK
ncbi:MAG: NADH:ubiquinone oxidoreductase subunit J [Legionellales bacterium RIFCSPHIGHO2_12_FULL_37_14]|nr:MAG: NADH:ubiquinone oxidoreductase subunit J [Legionellales bacterium RIFCSPHIGHO2_12_FULL_37_14]